ncbi:MAG: hypothetical protein ACKO5L_11045 [Bacteroidota bacterium]
MKTLLIFLVLLQCLPANSQKIVLEVYERQEMSCFRKTTLDSVLLLPDAVYAIDTVDARYVIDLDEKTSTYTRFNNPNFISVLPIAFEQHGKEMIQVHILEDGFDYGLFLNPIEENALWYWYDEDMTTVKKITQFRFVKSS